MKNCAFCWQWPRLNAIMAMSSRRVPGISQLPVHGSTMHDDGENAMEKQWTEQDLHSFVQTAQAVFDSVSLTEEQPEPGWQDESLQVDYELRGGRVDCVLHRIVEADGKRWKLQMSAPLAGNVLPEERMTPREREPHQHTIYISLIQFLLSDR